MTNKVVTEQNDEKPIASAQVPHSTARWPEVDDALRARLARGAQEREVMRQQIERGEQPQGVRAEWLRAGANVIVHVVAEQCDRFNAEHPEQAPSLADALDLLWTARATLLAMAGRLPRKPEDP